ncbi:MAG: AAA family ATPase [Gammaproteobacteria bacterium]|nr:AAA family ATPase [Gammaproteobacteria bacterium]
MRLPTYDEVARVEEQLNVYEAPFNESLFVVGPPGSGKTVLAIHRAQMMASTDTTVVFVTYNRMLRRLTALLAERQIQAKTMHKFMSDHYRAQTHCNPPASAPYSYDWDTISAKLEQLRIGPDSIHMVIDEGQDLPQPFFRYVRKFVATHITVFADENQALDKEYSRLTDIKSAAGLDNPILLSGNHRNTPEIAHVAGHFHVGDIPMPEVHRKPSGELPRIVSYGTLGEAAERISNWYLARGRRVGVVVMKNNTGLAVQEALQSRVEGHRVDFYSSEMKNEDSIDLLGAGITVLNAKSVKGQEFDTVFVMEVNQFLQPADHSQRVMYMLCSRARDNLILMHEGNRLPDTLLAQLPGRDFLERP